MAKTLRNEKRTERKRRERLSQEQFRRKKMINMRLLFVPPGGGETDYGLDFALPAIPRPGDYISVMRPNQSGSEDFIVRRTWWQLNYPEGPSVQDAKKFTPGSISQIYVECEFAKGPYSSENHSKSCEVYGRKGKLQEFDQSAY
jgi:hypothetical protein